MRMIICVRAAAVAAVGDAAEFGSMGVMLRFNMTITFVLQYVFHITRSKYYFTTILVDI